MQLNLSLLMLSTLLSFFSLLLLSFLFIYHLYLILNNMTTQQDYSYNLNRPMISLGQVCFSPSLLRHHCALFLSHFRRRVGAKSVLQVLRPQ